MSARRLEGRSPPARVLDQRLDGRGHQHHERRMVARDRVERRVGRETRVDRDRRAEVQRRRGLDVEPADMEHRQHGQHVIGGGKVVHVLAHRAVPEQRLLAQHRALRTSGGAGGVDHQQRRRHVHMRVTPVAACRVEQRCQRGAVCGAKSSPMMRASGSAAMSGGTTAAKASSTTSAFTEASVRMNTCSGTASRQLSGTSMAPSRAQA